MPHQFVRFEVEDTDFYRGIFGVAHAAMRRNVQPYSGQLDEAVRWFDKHLPSPPFMRHEHFKLLDRGRCWFRSDARKLIEEVEARLVPPLEALGYKIKRRLAPKLHPIIWEDSHQVVVKSPRLINNTDSIKKLKTPTPIIPPMNKERHILNQKWKAMPYPDIDITIGTFLTSPDDKGFSRIKFNL